MRAHERGPPRPPPARVRLLPGSSRGSCGRCRTGGARLRPRDRRPRPRARPPPSRDRPAQHGPRAAGARARPSGGGWSAECFRHFGAALCDAISATRFDATELCHLFTLEGWEHLDEAERLGKGLFLLTAHLGFWELSPPLIGLTRGPMSIVVRPADNPFLDRELRAMRERFGNTVIPKRGAARRMLEVMRERGRLGILIDQRVQEREGIAVPFFGRPALTSPILARLSLRTGDAGGPAHRLPRAGRPLPRGGPRRRSSRPRGRAATRRSSPSPAATWRSPRRTSARTPPCGSGCTGGGTERKGSKGRKGHQGLHGRRNLDVHGNLYRP